jgi:hypothetical protein
VGSPKRAGPRRVYEAARAGVRSPGDPTAIIQ